MNSLKTLLNGYLNLNGSHTYNGDSFRATLDRGKRVPAFTASSTGAQGGHRQALSNGQEQDSGDQPRCRTVPQVRE